MTYIASHGPLNSRICFVLIIFVSMIAACRSTGTDSKTEAVERSVAVNTLVRKNAVDYLGCWSGSGGGRVEITSRTIADLGSGESSEYEELSRVRPPENGPANILFRVNDVFKKSFLSQFILMKFQIIDDREVAEIYSYDEESDIASDKYAGRGVFVKESCDDVK